MTTESKQEPRRGVSPLLGSMVLSLVGAVGVSVAGGIFGGAAGARGAAAGSVATVITFAWGVMVVGAVALVMPSASLLVALLTYALQVMLMGVLALAMMRVSDGGDFLAHGWVAAGIVTLALVWMAAQIWWTSRLRTLAYELPEQDARPDAEAGS